MKFGSQLPEFMKPMLQAMADMGLLTDDAGNALKDLSRFSFTDSIESSFKRMADILAEIRDLLAFGLPEAAAAGAGKIGGQFIDVMPRIINGPIDYGAGDGSKRGVAMPTYDGYASATSAWSGSTGVSVPDSGGNVTVMAMDVQSFEGWLRSGANRAVMRTLPYAVSGAGLTR
jgi:hypothetical protein